MNQDDLSDIGDDIVEAVSDVPLKIILGIVLLIILIALIYFLYLKT